MKADKRKEQKKKCKEERRSGKEKEKKEKREGKRGEKRKKKEKIYLVNVDFYKRNTEFYTRAKLKNERNGEKEEKVIR